MHVSKMNMLVHKGKKLKADIIAGEVVDTELLIQRNKFPPEIKKTDENANIKGFDIERFFGYHARIHWNCP